MSTGSTSKARYRENRPFIQPSGIKPGDKVGELIIYSGGNPSQTFNRICTGVTPTVLVERCWDYLNKPRRGQNGVPAYSDGRGFALVKVNAPGTVWSGKVVLHNIGKAGITQANRYEYKGRFAVSLFDEIDKPHYGTVGGLNVDLNPFFSPITPADENAAWNIRPKLERYSLSNALFELREMPALLRQNAVTFREIWNSYTGAQGGVRMLARGSTDKFLSVEFGWKPFVGDVLKMLDTLVSQREYLEQLAHKNSKWIKRKRVLSESEVTTHKVTLLGHGLQPTFGDVGNSNLFVVNPSTGSIGDRTLERIVKVRCWASGHFRFYRPELDLMRDDMYSIAMHARRAILAHGLRINPTHLWKAVPWSWLIDWFTNFGDLIARADEAYNDSMVSRNLFVMKQMEVKVVQTHWLNTYSGPLTFKVERNVISKLRRKADSPFGFVLGGALSQHQLTILGALGLGRSASFVRTL